MKQFNEEYAVCKQQVLNELSQTLDSVDVVALERLSKDILSSKKVFLVGVGRVLLSLQAFAKRLSHLGVDAHCVGDICEPAITEEDLLIVGSGSGMSVFPVAIAKVARKYNAKIVHIGSNPHGDVAEYTDYMVRIPVRTKLYLEDEINSQQPMTSLFEQSLYLVGDILAMMIIRKQNLDLRELWQFHANLE